MYVVKAADIQFMMHYPLDSLPNGSRKWEFVVGPNTRAWIARIHRRPSYRRSLERLRAEETFQHVAKSKI